MEKTKETSDREQSKLVVSFEKGNYPRAERGKLLEIERV